MRFKVIVLTLVALFATSALASAQILSGTVSGVVKDDQGGVLPGVLVTLQGVDATQTYTTESNGDFRFLNLAPGPYKVTVVLPGFSTLVREDIIVAVGKSVELPVTLKIASVAETITVSGETPDRRHQGDRHGDQLHVRRAHEDPDVARSVRADARGAGRARRSRQHRRQRNRPAVQLRLEGHAPQDVVWTMDGINITDMGVDVVADVFQLRQLRRDSGVDRSGRTSSSRPAGWG